MVGPQHVSLSRIGALASGVVWLAAILLVPGQVYAEDVWTRGTLTGDWGGIRSRLSEEGIDWSLTYTGEVFANTTGGLIRGTSYEDLIEFEVDADLDKLVGWGGATAHITLYQIDNGGRNANDLVGAISDPSDLDALPTFRLFTLYVEQSFGDKGSLRVGQIAADDEFALSDAADHLINGTFGWENYAAANLPGGGPGYPLATPGVRLKWHPTENTTALGAIFNGNPAGNDCPPSQDPERCNYHGTLFSLDAGTLYMGEVQYRPSTATQNADNGGPLASVYRLGGWYHDGGFEDLGDPSQTLDGNWLLYGILDQTVWHNGRSALSVFARIAGAPQDRNPIPFYVGGGFSLTAPFAARPDDVLAFGFAYSDLSGDLADFSRQTRRDTGVNVPIENGETVIELTYVAQITPWWSLQPDLQYIMNPGGNVADPDGDPTDAVDDSFLIGLRTEIAF